MSSIGETSLIRNLSYLSESQAITANNLANVNSHGFKRRIAVPEPIGQRFDRFVNHAFPRTAFSQHLDWSVGAVVNSDDPSHIALRDDSLFIRVRQPGGEIAYTRSAQLALDGNNQITTQAGALVLDEADEPIALSAPEGQPAVTFQDIRITAGGQLQVEGGGSAQLGLYRIADQTKLTPVGNGNYSYAGEASPPFARTNNVLQRYTERSNVEVMGEMVQMISNQRGFQTTMSAMTTLGRIKEAYVSAFNR